MAWLRNFDPDLGEAWCAVKDCLRPPVQTVRMKCAPYVRKGETVTRRDIKEEAVGMCEGHYREIFPIRAAMIPQRFVDGKETANLWAH